MEMIPEHHGQNGYDARAVSAIIFCILGRERGCAGTLILSREPERGESLIW